MKGLFMTKLGQIRSVCVAVLRVAAFYALMAGLWFLLTPLMVELYISTPFAVFAGCGFFLLLFMTRSAGCLIFMPKSRLKAILRDGELSPTASQIVLRLFSWPFLKRVTMYFVLFLAEFCLRVVLINAFLLLINATLAFWANLSMRSIFATNALLFVAAGVVMELPVWAVFYKLSFKGRANRSREYRFGLKLCAFVVLFLIMHFCLFFKLSPVFPTKGGEAFLFLLSAVLGTGLWWLMYRCERLRFKCPLRRRTREEKELRESFDNAEKVAETIIEIETSAPAAPDGKTE